MSTDSLSRPEGGPDKTPAERVREALADFDEADAVALDVKYRVSPRFIHDVRLILSQRSYALAEAAEAKKSLSDAAREIPNIAGPVAHRIRMLRKQLATARAELERLRAMALKVKRLPSSPGANA